MSKQYFIYILASKKQGALYIGITSNLEQRIWQHKSKVIPSHTSKYNINQLVYFEQTTDALSAIAREKRLKKWKRAWKVELIESINPDWRDLYDEII